MPVRARATSAVDVSDWRSGNPSGRNQPTRVISAEFGRTSPSAGARSGSGEEDDVDAVQMRLDHDGRLTDEDRRRG